MYPTANRRVAIRTSSRINQAFDGQQLRTRATTLHPNMWNLPTTRQTQGILLVLPDNIKLYTDVISRWESITTNLVDDPDKTWRLNRVKMQYIENLLREDENKSYLQWKATYPNDYAAVEKIVEDTQNVISQIRRIFILEDSYPGSTYEQNRAYNDLRLCCDDVRHIFKYLNDFKKLASKLGRVYFPDVSKKLFRKMSPLLGKEVEEAWNVKYPRTLSAVTPRIHFTYQYLAEVCKKAYLQRSMNDLSFCSKIPIS